MTLRLLVAFGLLVYPAGSSAQSLDIGGIEIRLGQSAPEALRSLASYQARYAQDLNAWFISQRVGSNTEFLGHFSAVNARVAYVSKNFAMKAPDELPAMYTAAMRETKRRGGQRCVLSTDESGDGLIHQIDTRCGPYRLNYFFPFRNETGFIAASVAISIGRESF